VWGRDVQMSLGALLGFWGGGTSPTLAAIFSAVPPPYIWTAIAFLSVLIAAGLTWTLYAMIRKVAHIATLSRNYAQLRAIVQSQSDEILYLQETLRAYATTPPPAAWAEQEKKFRDFANRQLHQLCEELRLKSEKNASDMATLTGAVHRLQTFQSEFSAKIDALRDTRQVRNGETVRANGHGDEWSSFVRNQLASLRAEMDFDMEADDAAS
jgi:hypothetical protein